MEELILCFQWFRNQSFSKPLILKNNRFQYQVKPLTGINWSLLDSELNFILFRTLMIKLITRFVLSLSILLSSGYSQLYAHAVEEAPHYSPSNSLLSHQNSTVDSDFASHLQVLHNHSSGTVKVDATDIEEKEILSKLFEIWSIFEQNK